MSKITESLNKFYNMAVKNIKEGLESLTSTVNANSSKLSALGAPHSFTLTTDGWTAYTADGGDNNYYKSLAVSGMTTSDVVDATIGYNSIAAARDCGLNPTVETANNVLLFRSKKIPTESIQGSWHYIYKA